MINEEYMMNMKTMKIGMVNGASKKNEAGKLVAAILAAGLASGCTYTAAKRATVSEALADESRALTTAVVESLQSQPETNRDPYTVVALAFAKQDQRVEGLPEKPFDVPALLAGMGVTSNIPPLAGPPGVEAAHEEVAARFEKQEALLSKRAAAEARLIERGVVAEAERNKRISRWTKFGVWGTTLIGGAVALFVFCPIALPICGRLLAWLVGKIPSLASGLGVVSVKAFDAVLRGVENAKNQHAKRELGDPRSLRVAPTVPVANTLPSGDSRRGQETWVDKLHNQLSREMDAAHKALVRARKIKLA
jgi:hypothetical protein